MINNQVTDSQHSCGETDICYLYEMFRFSEVELDEQVGGLTMPRASIPL